MAQSDDQSLQELPHDFDTNLLPPPIKKEGSKFNPWIVQSFEEFLFYCCPECSFKSRVHNDFNSHALVTHPMVSFKVYL